MKMVLCEYNVGTLDCNWKLTVISPYASVSAGRISCIADACGEVLQS